jgi:Na+/melibiose symporter-like transporter
MPWYIGGFVVSSLSILPLFVDLDSSDAIEYLYYVGFGVLYNVSWAAIQVSHMSLVPSLTPKR